MLNFDTWQGKEETQECLDLRQTLCPRKWIITWVENGPGAAGEKGAEDLWYR